MKNSTMLAAVVLASFLSAGTAFADQENDQPTALIRDVVVDTGNQSKVPAKPKKPVAVAPVKGKSYVLNYFDRDDRQYYYYEVVPTGRSASFCDGLRYEVAGSTGDEDFTYFALPRELRRIFQSK